LPAGSCAGEVNHTHVAYILLYVHISLAAYQHSASIYQLSQLTLSFLLLCRHLWPACSRVEVEEKMEYLVEVEPATEAAGPVYRNVQAKDGLLQLPPGVNSCWDIFR
jgi:hypothetical protein